MMSFFRNPATYIFGVPFFAGFVLVFISPVFFQQDASAPWDEIVLAVGSTLLAAVIGRFVADVGQTSDRRVLAIAAVGVVFLLVWLYAWEGFHSELLVFIGIIMSVAIAEGPLLWLQRWCQRQIGGTHSSRTKPGWLRRLPWRGIGAYLIGSLIFGIALIVALCLSWFSILNFGWDRTVLFLMAYLIGNICDQAKDVASRNRRTAQGWRDVWRDVCNAFTEAWNNKYSAEFLYRSVKWGALTGAGQMLSQMITPSMH